MYRWPMRSSTSAEQAIIRVILRGERDPQQLAKLRYYRVAASEAEIAHSLEGNWREDVLFELQQVVDAYDFHQKQIAACDVQLQKYLSALPIRRGPEPGQPSPTNVQTKQPRNRPPHKL